MNLRQKPFYKNQDFLSTNQFNEHIRLYHGYVEKANTIANRPITPVGEYYVTKMQEGFNLNGVLLHELYFENIANTIKIHKAPNIEEVINSHFIEFSDWWDDFDRCSSIAKGWVIFGFEPLTKTYRNITLSTHDSGFPIGFKPLLVLDCYEHAYFMDYGTNKNRYVYDFMTYIDWQVVEQRLKDL